MKANLYIVGTGSQARYIIETIRSVEPRCKYALKGLIDVENPVNIGKKINGLEVICTVGSLIEHVDREKDFLIIAYGKNDKKEKLVYSLQGYHFATIINPASYISNFVEIGEGCIINPNVTISPNTKIGNHVIIHSGCTIEHDNNIRDFTNISPGVTTAGYVTIGRGCYIYTGAVIIPKKKIGDYSTVGAGSVVTKDVKPSTMVVGNPAKVIK